MEQETKKNVEQEKGVITEQDGDMKQPQETEDTPPSFRKKIGNTTYIVTAHFSKTSKQTMSDIICRMIKLDIERRNY